MPTDETKKTIRPKTVEILDDDNPSQETASETTPTSTSDQKVTSFSMLDTTKSKPSATTSTPDESTKAAETPAAPIESVDQSPAEETTPSQETSSEDEKPSSSEDIKEWLKDVRPDTSKEIEKGGGPGIKTFLLVLFILAILGAVVGGIFYYKSQVSSSSDGQETGGGVTIATPTPTSEVTPTPEAMEEVDFSKYTLNILNGSGIAGEAGKVAALLEEITFSDVSTGNAESYDYATTEVFMKEDVPLSAYEQIRDLLSENYTVAKADDVLESDYEYNIEIIVGQKK